MCQQVVVVVPPAPNFCQCQEDTLTTTPRSPYTVTIEETHVQNPLVLKHKTPSDDGTSILTISTTTRLSLVMEESKSIAYIAIPMILTGLLLYSRSMISMLFLGGLGDLALAGGSLAVGFANITGYSILSGLAMGLEPICGQAFGAKKLNLLGLTLQRTILLLLLTSIPISFLWLNMKRILLFCGQDLDISSQAQLYLVCSIPDLLAQSFLHPLRIYLRSQSITLPLTFCAALSILIHFPVNYILVCKLGLGIKGVALSGVLTNTALVLSLVIYIVISGAHKRTWGGFSRDCFREWAALLGLAIPSCVSVCLEWWWYEIMILLCGLLLNPRATVASMGVLIQTTSLIYIFPSSLSFGVSTRVGNELGAGNPARARLAARVGMGWSVAVGVIALGFAVAVRDGWAGVFTGDEEIGRMTAAVLPILGLCELGNCPQTTGCGVLRGTARPKVGANVNLGCFYLVGAPVAVGLTFLLGYDLKGLWLGLLAAQLSCLVSMVVILGRTDWAREAHRAQLLTWGGGSDSMGLGVGKGADDEEEKTLTVKILVDDVPHDFSIDA